MVFFHYFLKILHSQIIRFLIKAFLALHFATGLKDKNAGFGPAHS